MVDVTDGWVRNEHCKKRKPVAKFYLTKGRERGSRSMKRPARGVEAVAVAAEVEAEVVPLADVVAAMYGAPRR